MHNGGIRFPSRHHDRLRVGYVNDTLPKLFPARVRVSIESLGIDLSPTNTQHVAVACP